MLFKRHGQGILDGKQRGLGILRLVDLLSTKL